MPSGARTVAAVLGVLGTVATVLITAGACSGTGGEPASPASLPSPLPTSFDDGCVVGRWRLVSVWQRIDLDGDVVELDRVSGIRELRLAADGTGTSVYLEPLVLRGRSDATTLEAEISGRTELTYSAMFGTWREEADGTKAFSTLTLNGEKDAPRPGSAEQTLEADYTCQDDVLIISKIDYRIEYQRR